MKFYIGLGILFFSVFAGYMGAGGHLKILFQPFEFLIIFGSGIASFVIANPGHVVDRFLTNLNKVIKGPKYSKNDYAQLLNLLFSIFKLAKNKGMLSLEPHVENPFDSAIFQKFPSFMLNHSALTFTCDYLRLLTMGNDNAMQMEDLMNQELEVLFHDDHLDVVAVEKMADGMPALGIVAAVLGVIHTMESISQPPEVLGGLIGAALVGTFLGILVSYGVVSPIAQNLKYVLEADQKYLICIKTAIIAYMNGNAPIIVIEYGRKILDEHYRPSFTEMEELTQQNTDG